MPVSIWAPRVSKLELVTSEGSVPLANKDRGTFESLREIPPGTRYGFRVDGQGPFPDPRSSYQPDGVHGMSMVWDHEAYRFENESFHAKALHEAVLYELHIGTFSQEGTFLGAIPHLDHLVDLGITHIELLPLFAFPGHHGWGYDGVAPFAPPAAYGTPDDLKRLVDAAHGRGLAVVLDIVFNHLGPDGNYLGLYAPYFTDRYRTPWGDAVNLDGPDSDLVRQTWIDSALFWLDTYRFDGLRLDAVHALYDQSAVHFLEELAKQVAALEQRSGRSLWLVAECDLNDPRYVLPPSVGGFGLHAQWCDEFHHALHAVLTGETDGYYEDFGSIELLAKALRQGYVYDGTWSRHRRRFHGRPPEGVRANQMVVFSQNHDQVGNRAHGERLAQLVEKEKLFQAAALTLLSPFVPLLFQGEEWGTQRPFLYFTDHQDQALGKSVTEGRRREFGYFKEHRGEVPDPQALSTFERSKLDWSERTSGIHQELLQWHRTLLGIRKKHHLGTHQAPPLVHFDEKEKWLFVKHGPLLVFVNLSKNERALPDTVPELQVLARSPSEWNTTGSNDELVPPLATLVALVTN